MRACLSVLTCEMVCVCVAALSVYQRKKNFTDKN